MSQNDIVSLLLNVVWIVLSGWVATHPNSASWLGPLVTALAVFTRTPQSATSKNIDPDREWGQT